MMGIIVLIGIVIMVMISTLFNDRVEEERINGAKAILASVENELFLASKVSSGYKRSFDIPDNINTKNYSITILGESIILIYGGITFEGVSPNATGNFNIGTNNVYNINGKVCLNTLIC